MKRVGILTAYYKNYNYGGQLQAYALCKKLLDIGYKAQQISYSRERKGKERSLKRKIERFLFTKENSRETRKDKIIYHITHMICDFYKKGHKKFFEQRKEKFDIFMEQIPHSPVYDADNISECVNRYEYFICGSDQIWNPFVGSSDDFLGFVPDEKRKASYAASFGVSSLNEREKQFVKKYIKKLDMISVREEAGKEILQDILGRETDVLLDPTLLLEKADWEEVAADRLIERPYVFAYFLGNNYQNKKAVKRMSREKGCQLVYLPFMDNRYHRGDFFYGDIRPSAVGPKEFLSLIKYADYVVTDSFHGTVFSVLYEKNFCIFLRNKATSKNHMNSRIYSLLRILELENCLVEKESDMRNCLEKNANFAKVKKNIEREKNRAEKYLKTFLEM